MYIYIYIYKESPGAIYVTNWTKENIGKWKKCLQFNIPSNKGCQQMSFLFL
jgi:hypothetical protein